MNLSDLTPEQREQVLHHFRAAALARATQWDHELAIESILDREIDVDFEIYADSCDANAQYLTPGDITHITHEDVADAIPDED